MTVDEAASRLSKISTQWPELAAAHADASSAVSAQASLLSRYCSAVHHYLLASTRDQHAAEELGQEFALRFVRGDFHRAEQARGRFRDFIKAVLRNLVADHYRRLRNRPAELRPDSEVIAPGGYDPADADAEFNSHWRQELLDRTWEEFRTLNEGSNQPYHDVLRWKADHPDRNANDGAEEFTRRLGRDVKPAAFRQMLHRAREGFAELLLAEVARSLGGSDPELIARELADLGLLVYCGPALEKVGSSAC